MSFVMGIDLGTAGVRTAVIDAADVMIAAASVPMQSPVRVENRPCQDPTLWWHAVCQCLGQQAGTLGAAGHPIGEL